MFQMSRLAAGTLLAAALMAGSANAQTVLRSSDTHPDGYPTVEAVKYFGQLVEERTAGRYKVEVYFGAQLGQEADTIEQVRSGRDRSQPRLDGPVEQPRAADADPVVAVPVPLAGACPRGHVGPDRRRDRRRLRPARRGGLAFYDGGARSFYNSKKPINSPADIAGMKIRVIQSDMFVDMVAALGANGHADAFGEVYSAIETGVIDGAENNFPELRIGQAFRGGQELFARRAHDRRRKCS
jgi:TRAP-type C4-dicarboxylate transport system substrate-binding protein